MSKKLLDVKYSLDKNMPDYYIDGKKLDGIVTVKQYDSNSVVYSNDQPIAVVDNKNITRYIHDSNDDLIPVVVINELNVNELLVSVKQLVELVTQDDHFNQYYLIDKHNNELIDVDTNYLIDKGLINKQTNK